jgi:hypothetical protein
MATDEIEYNAYYHTLQVWWLFDVARMKTQGEQFSMNVTCNGNIFTCYFTE